MSGWTEQELIYEAAFQYEWGYSSELEKAARECIDRIKADAWDECEDSAYFNPEVRDQVSHAPNPYRDNP